MSRELLIRELREVLDSIRWEAHYALNAGSLGCMDACEWIEEVLSDHPLMRDESKTVIIVAWDENRLIGNKGQLPWKQIKGDLPFFKKMTTGHPIVMGRNTADSLAGPLPGRDNILVTSHSNAYCGGYHIYKNLEEAIEYGAAIYAPPRDVFLIGGAQLYKSALDADLVDKMLVSEVKGKYEGDVYFPAFDESKWTVSTFAEFEEFTVKEWRKK